MTIENTPAALPGNSRGVDPSKPTRTVNPGDKKALLKQRAEKLAQKEKTGEHLERIEVVEFRMAEERYGVECLYVKEVYPLRQLTPIPGTPDFIMGIISVRGEIISVTDLKRFFEMPRGELTDLTRVIILRHPAIDMTYGIVAEEVMGTLSVPVKDIQSQLPMLTGVRADYLKGVAKSGMIVLDASKLLSDKKMIVNQDGER